MLNVPQLCIHPHKASVEPVIVCMVHLGNDSFLALFESLKHQGLIVTSSSSVLMLEYIHSKIYIQ